MSFRVKSDCVVASEWSEGIARALVDKGIRRLSIHVEGPDLSFLGVLPPMEMLDLSVRRPRDLRLIEGVQVEDLSLTMSPGKLVAPVDFRRVRGLRDLGVDWVNGLGVIRGGPSLERLVVSRAPSVDERALGELPNLRVLWLNSCRNLTSLAGIERFELLEEFSAYSLPKLESLAGLERLPRLQRLDVEACKRIGDLEPIGTCSGLTSLGVKNCGDIASLAPLRGLPRLTEFLAWESTRVKDGDLGPLLALPHLEAVAMQSRREYRPSVADIQAELRARGHAGA